MLQLKNYENINNFTKRLGINILFSLLKTETYLNDIYEILNSFKGENEYYVNMVNAWIICELFIKHRTQTIVFLKLCNITTFIVFKSGKSFEKVVLYK